jgi:hypothetical protein
MNNRTVWALSGLLASYFLLARRGKRGGATYDEVNASLPGDEVIPHPMAETTHAITVKAPPSAIWPWLVQAGYRGAGRAGWYSDAWWTGAMERSIMQFTVPGDKLGRDSWKASPDRILPEFQRLAVGDIVPDGPPGSAYLTVRRVEPGHLLALYSDTHIKYMSPTFLHGTRWCSYGDFTWVFVLSPVGENATRLILRTRARFGPPFLGPGLLPLFYLGEAFIPDQILKGIQRRAEHADAGERRVTGESHHGKELPTTPTMIRA